MKIAVCISGHMRTYQSTFKFYEENLFKPLRKKGEVDVFISTWANLGYRMYQFGMKDDTSVDPKDIERLYNPKSMIIEKHEDKQAEFEEIGKYGTKAVHKDKTRTFSLYYKIASCNNLKKEYEKKHNFVYDFVIRIRPDLSLTKPYFDFGDSLEKLFEEFLLFCRPDDIAINQPSDIFFGGTSKTMDIVCNLYYNFRPVYDFGQIFCPHLCLKNWLKMNNIVPKVIMVGNSIICYE